MFVFVFFSWPFRVEDQSLQNKAMKDLCYLAKEMDFVLKTVGNIMYKEVMWSFENYQAFEAHL